MSYHFFQKYTSLKHERIIFKSEIASITLKSPMRYECRLLFIWVSTISLSALIGGMCAYNFVSLALQFCYCNELWLIISRIYINAVDIRVWIEFELHAVDYSWVCQKSFMDYLWTLHACLPAHTYTWSVVLVWIVDNWQWHCPYKSKPAIILFASSILLHHMHLFIAI